MSSVPSPRFSAFRNHELIGQGDLPCVAEMIARSAGDAESGAVLVLDDETGRVVDLDLRGDIDAVRERATRHPMNRPCEDGASEAAPVKRKRGRPSLGVVAREVTLLPRHWDWLDAQGKSASAILRELVEKARKEDEGVGAPGAARRLAQESAYRALNALAGDLPLYEEAIRALFADDRAGMIAATQSWPEDIRAYALRLGFPDRPETPERRQAG